MRIGLLVSAPHVPGYALDLEAQLAALRAPRSTSEVMLVGAAVSEAERRPASLTILLELERVLNGRARRWLADVVPTPAGVSPGTAADTAGLPELLIDLTSRRDGPRRMTDARVLTPLLDGHPIERGLWTALLDRRAPLISLHDSHGSETLPLALPAIEAPHRLLESAEAVLAHLLRTLTDAVTRIIAGGSLVAMPVSPPPEPHIGRTRVAPAFLLDRIARKARSAIAERLGRAPVWQTAWRKATTRTHPPSVFDTTRFQRLADDGQRYYADPFVFAHDGVTHLFVEELPYATGRGILSHMILQGDGQPVATPVPVLETAHHLSYPLVFAADGQIWMLPECAASGRLDLYRADPFPLRWTLHATLVDAPLHDATIFRHAGRWWITAGLALDGTSSWDTLVLYSAERLTGPWQAHPANPVLVDARSARPAGAIYEHGGALWRPAQDCTAGYGSALSLCRIDRLDDTGFAQSLVTTLRFGREGDCAGPHTLNLGGGIEVVDLFAPRTTPGAEADPSGAGP